MTTVTNYILSWYQIWLPFILMKSLRTPCSCTTLSHIHRAIMQGLSPCFWSDAQRKLVTDPYVAFSVWSNALKYVSSKSLIGLQLIALAARLALWRICIWCLCATCFSIDTLFLRASSLRYTILHQRHIKARGRKPNYLNLSQRTKISFTRMYRPIHNSMIVL